MATASECYAALCTIRSAIVEQLRLLGYDVEANDCTHMCLTDLIGIYADYTGRTYTVEDLDTFIDETLPSAEWLNKVVSCNGNYATCVEANTGEYEWVMLDEQTTLVDHTIRSDGVYNAADFGADGFSIVTVDTSEQRDLQNKTVSPSSTTQRVSADEGFVGLGTVTVTPIQVQQKTVVPTVSIQEVLPDDGFFLDKVTVDAVINQSKEAVPGTSDVTIEPDVGYNGLSRVVVNGEPNLLPENIVSGVGIFNVVGTATAGQSGKPVEISTISDMNIRRAAASVQTAGIVYHYTGPTTDTYIANSLYSVTTSEPYVLVKLNSVTINLDKAVLTLTDNVLSWTAVPLATKYYVSCPGYLPAWDVTTNTTYVLQNGTPGVHSIYVTAVCDGYNNSYSNTVVSYIGNISVKRHTTLNFPIIADYTVGTEFNGTASFIGTYNRTSSALVQYSDDLTYSMRSMSVPCSAACATETHMFAIGNSIEVLDADMVSTILEPPNLYDEYSYKSATALSGNAIVAGNGYIVSIDDNLVCTILAEASDYYFNGYNNDYNYGSATSNDTFAAIGCFHRQQWSYENTGSFRVGDGYSHIILYDTNLVSSTVRSTYIQNAETGMYFYVAFNAATPVGSTLTFAGGRIRTFSGDGIVVPTYEYYSFMNTTLQYINNDYSIGDVKQSLTEGKYSLAAATISGFGVYGGGVTTTKYTMDTPYSDLGLELSQSEVSSTVNTISPDLVASTSDNLASANARIAAVTVKDAYLIFSGGGAMQSDTATAYKIIST